MAHVAEYKKKIVADLVRQLVSSPIIGAVDMENLPAPQLQKMRAQLRGKVSFAMTKRRLMKIAIAQAKEKKKGVEEIEKYLKGMPALIFTNENPFKLYRMLEKNKSPAPAKAGQTAPRDIIVPAGPTSFAPGPIIGELGQIGIRTGVEGGKVSVKSDSIVAKAGEKIKPKVAEVLTRLAIMPMEVGLDLVAVYENGVLYTKDVLSVDEVKLVADMGHLANSAFNVAMFIGYTTKDTIKPLISKAFREAKAIGLSQSIIDEGIVEDLIGRAERQMLGLKTAANIPVVVADRKAEAPKPEAKEEKKAPKEHKIKEKPVEKKPEIREMPEEKPEPAKEIASPPKMEELSGPEEKIELPEPEEKKEILFQPEPEEKPEHGLEDTDAKIRELVEKTKKFAAHKEPTADELLKEAESSRPRHELKKVPGGKPAENVPTVQELAEKKRHIEARTEQEQAEKLFEQLKKKGTLRK